MHQHPGWRNPDPGYLEQGGCFPCCTQGVFKGPFTSVENEATAKTLTKGVTKVKVTFRIRSVCTSLKGL